MQRGGRANNDFFGFGDPFAGFEGFGRPGSLFASAFGGRDPFDDPFFTRPFGGMFGSSMFGPSMFDMLRSPLEHSQNTSFLEDQAPRFNSSGPVIQELNPDEEENGFSNVSEGAARGHPASGKEPYVQDPDEEMEDDKSSHMQYENFRPASGPSTVQPQKNAYAFRSSSVTYGGADGAYYTSSSTRRTGGDGVIVEESKEADSRTGKATHKISRGLHGKGHSVTRKLNSDGRVDTMQMLHNLNEDELAGFNDAWRGSAGRHLPGWNHDADLLNTGSRGGGTPGRLALPSRQQQWQESGRMGTQTRMNQRGNAPTNSRRIFIE